MKNADIAVLVKKAQENKEGFGDLYKAMWGTAYYYCLRMLGNKQDAEDATQTVFVKLYRNLSSPSSGAYHPEAFNKFLYTTMKYTCIDFHKAKSRNETEEIEHYDISLFEENTEFLPAAAFDNEEWRNQVVKLVAALPDKQKEAILLFYFDEKPVKEIAEITDSKVDAVKNRLMAARKTLKERAEVLIKEGAMDRTLAIIPIPLLTQILQADAAQVATLEAEQVIWSRIATEIGLPAGTNPADASANQAQAATTQGAAASATTATTVNIALAVCALVAVGTLAFGAYYVNETFIQPLIAAADTNNSQPIPATMAIMEIEPLIREIQTRAEFVDFIQTHGFSLIGGNRSSYSGDQVLYFAEHESSFIYVGYLLDLEGNFRVVYETTDNTMPRIRPDEVRNWFFAR